jgi:high-affinity iron transporter
MRAAALQTAIFLTREGVETFLVLAAIRAHLSRVGASSKRWALYLGTAFAVATTVAIGSYSQPSIYFRKSLFEPLALLLIAGLMLQISGWLFIGVGRAFGGRYIRSYGAAVGSKTAAFWIAALAFVIVLREGFETILFGYATMVQSGGTWFPDVAAGLLIGALFLMSLCFALSRIVSATPLRLVFLLSSSLLFICGIKLIGAALHDMQNLGYVSRTAAGGEAWLTVLGFNPSWEALIVQFGIIASTALGFAHGLAKQRCFPQNNTGGSSLLASSSRSKPPADPTTGLGGK